MVRWDIANNYLTLTFEIVALLIGIHQSVTLPFNKNSDNMIKVKTFFNNSKNYHHYDRLDESINSFLAENDVEVVDVKYSVAIGGSSGQDAYQSAMLIYKTKE